MEFYKYEYVFIIDKENEDVSITSDIKHLEGPIEAAKWYGWIRYNLELYEGLSDDDILKIDMFQIKGAIATGEENDEISKHILIIISAYDDEDADAIAEIHKNRILRIMKETLTEPSNEEEIQE